MEMAKCGMPCMKLVGAVDGIDDEAVGPVGAGDLAAFFAQKAITGTGLAEFFDQYLSVRLSALVTEVGGPLHRDLKVFQFVEIADQRAGRLCARRAIITLRAGDV